MVQFGDILYVLFRHKWKIFFLTLVSLGGAAALWVYGPQLGRDQAVASLLIKYVAESRTTEIVADTGDRVRTPDPRGEAVLSTEYEILNSLDLVREVVNNLTPGVRAGLSTDTNTGTLLRVVKTGFRAEVPRKGSVITLSFTHSNPDVLVPVLTEIIAVYRKQHEEIHRPSLLSLQEKLDEQRRILEGTLKATESLLAQRRADAAGDLTLDDARRLAAEQIGNLAQQISDTSTQISERRAFLARMTNFLAAARSATPQTNLPATDLAPVAQVPQEKTDQYRRVRAALDFHYKRDQDYRASGFTSENRLVKENEEHIANYEKQVRELEAEYPSLLLTATPQQPRTAVGAEPATQVFDWATELARLDGLVSRLANLNQQMEEAKQNAQRLSRAEQTIAELQRQKELQETSYRTVVSSVQRAQLNQQLEPDSGTVLNISEVQKPSRVLADTSKYRKAAAGVLAGGLALAIGLAFLLEFYVDQTVKRPVEVPSRTGLPVFLSIPLRNHKGKAKHLKPSRSRALLAAANGDGGEKKTINTGSLPIVRHGRVDVAPWDPRHVLQPYYEALRDRLVTFFDLKGLDHKPKLVAVTSLSEGAGVSTIAAGLAASLSETGEGNVLLVDMNIHNGSAHKFHKGDLACGIDEALESEARKPAQVNENLFVVSETDNIEKLPSAMPRRLKTLMPKLKSSDYDYIIFDMPPVSQVSITPRIARHMDMVFMVAEAEKTQRDTLKRAGDLLNESQTHVAVVVNKTREYLPRSMRQEV